MVSCGNSRETNREEREKEKYNFFFFFFGLESN